VGKAPEVPLWVWVGKKDQQMKKGRSEIRRTNDTILIGTSVLSATREWYYL